MKASLQQQLALGMEKNSGNAATDQWRYIFRSQGCTLENREFACASPFVEQALDERPDILMMDPKEPVDRFG